MARFSSGATVLLAAMSACEPKVVAGEWDCPAQAPDAAAPSDNAPFPLPWSTGFETRFCDYAKPAAFCYTGTEHLGSIEIVTSPVHSGRYAAAFQVESDSESGSQARCVRQGVMPNAAYYGAWYYVPALVSTNMKLWNLWHFQGGDVPPAQEHGLCDVSLVNGTDGDLELIVYDFLKGVVRRPATATSIPIGAWFHIELYLKRAADATGELALYQDGKQLFDATNIVTDDAMFDQWYVGNLVDVGLPTPDFTVYVDDVTISASQ